MKICFISEHYPPTDGGVATSTRRIARELVKLGAVVYVFTFDGSKPLDSLDYQIENTDEGVNVFRFGPFFIKNKSVNKNGEKTSERIKAILRRRVFNRMYQTAEELNINIILSFYLLNAGHIAQLVANELGIPCVAGIRGNDIGRNIFNVQRFGVIQWVVNSATNLVCVNNHLLKRMITAFPEVRNKAIVIKNGITVDMSLNVSNKHRDRLTARMGWNEEDLIVTFAGNMREKKGVLGLIRALASFNRDGRRKVRFLLIGPEVSSIEINCIRDQWDELLVNNAVFSTGQIPREEVSQSMLGADVVLMPSIEDGLSNGLLEGMAVGLCPIVSNLYQNVVEHMKTGIIVIPGRSEDLVKAFDYLYDNRDHMKEMGKKAKEYVMAKHRAEDEASEYFKLFQKILNGECC